MTPDELRASMRSTQVYGKGQYIGNGLHLLEVEKALVNINSETGIETWIIEFKVIESSNPAYVAGSTISLAESRKNLGWQSRFKEALIAIAGIEHTPLTDTDQNTIADIFACIRLDDERTRLGWPVDFLKGRRVRCEGMPGKSRAGGEVTNKKWSPA